VAGGGRREGLDLAVATRVRCSVVGRHRVVDIRRLTGSRPELREEAARELFWLGSIVEVATACGVGARWERAIVRCDEVSCDSAVAVRRTGDACEWYCPSCATFGAIVGWRGSRWDLGEVASNDQSDRTGPRSSRASTSSRACVAARSRSRSS
jgi:hypothetical protein